MFGSDEFEHKIYRAPVSKVPSIPIESFLTRQVEKTVIKSPDGKTILDIECEWGEREGKWYFLSLSTRRRREEVPVNGN